MRLVYRLVASCSFFVLFTASQISFGQCDSGGCSEPAFCSITDQCDGGGCALGGCAATGDINAGVKRSCCWYQPYTEKSQPDIFYNYYAPNNNGSTAAALPAPYPTPSVVGHTYYTYQPLMPNEFLYTHRRSYHQYYNNGMGLNRTRVHWYHNPFSVVRGATRTFMEPRNLFCINPMNPLW